MAIKNRIKNAMKYIDSLEIKHNPVKPKWKGKVDVRLFLSYMS